MPLTVLLVDDHEVVRKGLRAALEAEPDLEIVGEAADGLEAVKLVERLHPHVVVMDLMMPGLNGLDTLAIVGTRFPATKVVVLSMIASDAHVSQALSSGALGYVLKGGPVSELITAIRAAAAGHCYLGPPLSTQAVEDFLRKAKSAGNDPHELLTPRERQVLQLAAEGKTCPDIGLRLHLSARTIEKHRANLMHKLGFRSQTDLVLYALRRGILPPDQIVEEGTR